jgi:hypothetical protein
LLNLLVYSISNVYSFLFFFFFFYNRKDESVKFGKAYPKINIVSLGPEPGLDPNVFEGIEELKNPYSLLGKVFTSAMAPWETGTLFLKIRY